MKTQKLFILVIFFSILIFVGLSVFATNSSEKQASDFQSSGDLIEGWYWLRDSARQDYTEWTFDNIPLSPDEITVKINALATDRPSGGRGFDAKFLLYYSYRGEGDIPLTYIPPQTVTLTNVSSPDDPLGYNCQGQVTIQASTIPAASRISLKIRRESARDNHVAFKENSIVLLTGSTPPFDGDHLPDTDDDFEGAVPIQVGTYTGSLGEENNEGHRDNDDYYSIDLEEGQQITLQLTIPGNAQYSISLYSPSKNSRGSSGIIIEKDTKTLSYVADSSGTWYIKIHRSSGEGEYQLAVDIQDQNDADSGQDAGKSNQEAIPVSSGTITGFLKRGDNVDYYSIDLVEGQLITLRLTVPENAKYRIGLSFPKKLDGGSIDRDDQGNIKILKHVIGKPGTGTWYIRVSRSSGEGDYQLTVNTSFDGAGEPDNYPKPNGESIPFLNSCRGACGGGTPDTARTLDPITIRIPNPQNDNSHYLLKYTEVIECGTHAGCRWHDACFDQCKLKGEEDVYGPYHDLCSAWVVDKYGQDNGRNWLVGLGPYDGFFIFSDEPTLVEGGPFPGSVHSFAEANYRIDVYTGSRWGAGTDANVYITLFGTDGSSSTEVLLDNSGMNDFEQAMRDTFYVQLKDFKDINRIRLRHDNSLFFAGWYVNEVRIINQDTGQLWHFITNRWLAEDEGDGQIDVEFPLSYKDERDYQIDVYTGDLDWKFGEGTDSNIYISLFGTNGYFTEEILLDYPWDNDFETGDHDTFYFIRIGNVGEINHIILRSDNSGIASDWYCKKIEIKETKQIAWEKWFIPGMSSSVPFPPGWDYYTGRKWVIPVNSWLTEDNPARTCSPK